ncbi:MAG TPA: 2-phosphosulfolactate phosphatase [Tepidisphaeraceae bacterium]|nr:2-phosphosulfolactate phosphatase [Tepidisphaeraceae bacterium]
MQAKVILLPRDLEPADGAGRTVVVFDVMRATTTITAALAAGVREVHVFGSVDAARQAAASTSPRPLLCGEIECLPPPGFDLGNSPRQWDRAQHAGSIAFLATTNGTRALTAAAALKPANLLVGAVVNAQAVGKVIRRLGADVTLLCAGTGGAVSMEDLIGAGAILDELTAGGVQFEDDGQVAWRLFQAYRRNLHGVFRIARGGRNLIRANHAEDIDFCAQWSCLFEVGQAHLPDATGGLTICPFELEDR